MAGRFSTYLGQFNNLLVREDYITYVSVIPARIEKIKPVADENPLPNGVKYTINIRLSPAVIAALGNEKFSAMTGGDILFGIGIGSETLSNGEKVLLPYVARYIPQTILTLVAVPNARIFSVIPNAVRLQFMGP